MSFTSHQLLVFAVASIAVVFVLLVIANWRGYNRGVYIADVAAKEMANTLIKDKDRIFANTLEKSKQAILEWKQKAEDYSKQLEGANNTVLHFKRQSEEVQRLLEASEKRERALEIDAETDREQTEKLNQVFVQLKETTNQALSNKDDEIHLLQVKVQNLDESYRNLEQENQSQRDKIKTLEEEVATAGRKFHKDALLKLVAELDTNKDWVVSDEEIAAYQKKVEKPTPLNTSAVSGVMPNFARFYDSKEDKGRWFINTPYSD